MRMGAGAILLGKYRIERELGAGAMGTVLAATHLALGQTVAIKVLGGASARDPEAMARFLREAQAAARLQSEHVVRVLDAGMLDDQRPFLVMEHLRGEDLRTMIALRGRLPVPLAIDLTLQVCAALADAHAAGIVHRDIKPANLFVTERPDGAPLVKVLDFGISKLASAEVSLTQSSTSIGTPAYMAPEQMRSAKDVDGRADVWGLGAVLFEGLSGRRAFDAETVSAVCWQVVMEPSPRLPVALPRGLDAVVHRCLAKAPAQRFATVADLAAALAPFAGDARAAAMIVERAARTLARSLPPPRARAPRRRVKMAALTVTGTAAALASAYLIGRDRVVTTTPRSIVPPAIGAPTPPKAVPAIAAPSPARAAPAPQAPDTRPTEPGVPPPPVAASRAVARGTDPPPGAHDDASPPARTRRTRPMASRVPHPAPDDVAAPAPAAPAEVPHAASPADSSDTIEDPFRE